MYEELAKYFSGNPALGPNSKDIAKYIVLNANVDRKPLKPKGSGSPSVMSRIFDVLSRPNYAIANSFKAIQHGDLNVLDDFVSGLSGTQKTTFGDVLKDAGFSGPGTAAAGFILDVGLDPTTYIPGAAIAKGAAKLKGATKLGKAEKEAEAVLKDRPRQDIELPVGETPDAFKATPEVTLPTDSIPKAEIPEGPFIPTQLQFDLPNVSKRPALLDAPVEEAVAKAPVGQLPLKFPDFKVSDIRKTAADTIEDLPVDLPKIAPVPKPVPTSRNMHLAQEVIQSFRPKGKAISRGQMVNLYNKAVNVSKKSLKKPSKARLNDHAFKTYLAVEQLLERQGFKIPDSIRLSDVIAKTNTEAVSKFINPKKGDAVWQAIEDLRASNAVMDAAPVQKIVESTAQTHGMLEAGNQLSDAQLVRVRGMLKNIAKESAKASGVSKEAEDAVVNLTKMALESGLSAAQLAVQQSKHLIEDVVRTGKASPKANRSTTHALERNLGNLPAWSVDGNKATEFLMGRVATWWGQKDLRAMSLNHIASAMNTAAARGTALDNMFEGMSITARSEVFRLAQGIPGIPSSPEIAIKAQQITRMMDNLVGRAAGTSVITRSGVNMDLLNKWMKQYKVGFLFERGKVKNYITGEEHDLSKGNDWLQTWKHVELPEDGKSFMFKLQQALEQSTREKALFDEIGERFGSITPGKGFRNKIEGYPYLDGYYFTDDIAKQLPRVIKDWTTPGFQGQSGLLGLYDRVLSMWKAGVTIYRPGHHVRNMVGDIYLGWMDGVNSVRPYKLAAQVQRSMSGLYTDLMNVDKLVELGVMGRDMATPLPGKILFHNKSGVGFTAEQIAAVAHQKGLLEHARTIEDIIDLGAQKKSMLDVKPFGGKVQQVARGASELQSHNARLAHFIDKVMKSRGSNLEVIFEDATRRARKWHPTGLDMTTFEKQVLRRIIPFYSWMRKSTPLLLEGLVMNPGKAVIPSKAYDAIQQAQGIDTPGRQDPFPVDQMFPEWLRAEGIGPIGLPGEGLLAKLSNQQPPGYTMAGMGLNPLTSMIAQMSDPGRMASTAMTPVFQIPIELMTGKKLFTGEPIMGSEARPGAFGQYLGEQLPIYGNLQNLTGITPFGDETKAVTRSDGQSRIEALSNWLTGAGVRGTGPYREQARYEALAPGKMEKRLGREQLMAALREQLNGNS